MSETKKLSTSEREMNTDLEKPSVTSETLLLSLGEEISDSMSYVNDSIVHVHGLMKGLQIKQDNLPSNAGQVLNIIDAHNHTAQTIQTTLNCSKEIRSLLKLKLDAAEFIHKVATKGK